MPAVAAKRILLVDDDDNLRRTLAEQLTMDGEFEAVEAATATEGLQKAKAGRFDIILLDVGLPDGDGRELCREMRRAQIATPIIMLTAVDGEADTIKGLEFRRQRLRHQAVPPGGTGGAGARASAPARAQRGRRAAYRPLRVQAGGEDAD